ncbi:cytochrome bd oxidase small subunit CydS [Oceanobacillus polygoni]|uniref:Uncharacterized protein n=1 Tax=Oceanobacillus polygoni TaxID=1235259 RepID=A0A9X0YQ78_9BACI|nr:hypothetical protein [Oceanobacillus polygoni]MBP2076787.1 hypothetical protein [Oceanobacillus polygoni]
MFNDFLIFVAPILVIIIAVAVAFWGAGKDKPVTKEITKEAGEE